MKTQPRIIHLLTILVVVSLLANVVMVFLFIDLTADGGALGVINRESVTQDPSAPDSSVSDSTAEDTDESSALSYQTAPRYTLYIGTDSQSTNEPISSLEEAIQIVDEICLRHINSFTSFEAQGKWLSPEGVAYREGTLVYLIYGASEDEIIAIVDEVLAALNQESVMIEYTEGSYLFYPQESILQLGEKP